jgi:mannose-6-phosphate isomerase-like protein (cupin superfamily)
MTLAPVTDVEALQRGMCGAWQSVDLAAVNGNAVRLRVMTDTTAPWHIHEASDEAFYVLSGSIVIDTEHGTREIRAGELFVVAAGTRHRARAIGRATMLVIDRIGT